MVGISKSSFFFIQFVRTDFALKFCHLFQAMKNYSLFLSQTNIKVLRAIHWENWIFGLKLSFPGVYKKVICWDNRLSSYQTEYFCVSEVGRIIKTCEETFLSSTVKTFFSIIFWCTFNIYSINFLGSYFRIWSTYCWYVCF